MKIAVIALGKIGLPLAVQFASKGHDVVGVDVNQQVVELINAGTEPFPGEAHLQEKLSELVPAGKLRATTDYADAVPGADAVVLVVPLFVDAEAKPDFGWMDGATAELAKHLTPGTLVSYETTLPVGTTRSRWKPALEAGSGLVEGKDFHLVFSPERVLTGRVFEDLRKYPKLVGGLSEAGAAKAVEFYEAVLDFDERADLRRPNGVWDLGSAEASELAKLAETTYRDVNIGLANQFARFAATAGIDIYQVIEASNSQPYSHIHQPGHRRRRPLHPGLSAPLPLERPRGDRGPGGPRCQRRHARLHGGPARGCVRRPDRRPRRRPGRRVPRRGEGDGLLRRLRRGRVAREARRRSVRARSAVHGCGTGQARLRARTTSASRSTRPSSRPTTPSTASCRPADLPGIKAFIDGRRVSSADRWDGVTYRVIGKA